MYYCNTVPVISAVTHNNRVSFCLHITKATRNRRENGIYRLNCSLNLTDPLATYYIQNSLITTINCGSHIQSCFVSSRSVTRESVAKHESRRRTGWSLTDTHSYVTLSNRSVSQHDRDLEYGEKNKPRKRVRAISECQTSKMKHMSRVSVKFSSR